MSMDYLQRNRLIRNGMMVVFSLIGAGIAGLAYATGYNDGGDDVNRININFMTKHAPDCLEKLNKLAEEHPESVTDPDMWTPWDKIEMK